MFVGTRNNILHRTYSCTILFAYERVAVNMHLFEMHVINEDS